MVRRTRRGLARPRLERAGKREGTGNGIYRCTSVLCAHPRYRGTQSRSPHLGTDHQPQDGGDRDRGCGGGAGSGGCAESVEHITAARRCPPTTVTTMSTMSTMSTTVTTQPTTTIKAPVPTTTVAPSATTTSPIPTQPPVLTTSVAPAQPPAQSRRPTTPFPDTFRRYPMLLEILPAHCRASGIPR